MIYVLGFKILIAAFMLFSFVYIVIRIGYMLMAYVAGDTLEDMSEDTFKPFRLTTSPTDVFLDSALLFIGLFILVAAWPVAIPAIAVWGLAYYVRSRNIKTRAILSKLRGTEELSSR